MMTINDFGKKLPHTLKEIVKINYPDFWNAATELINRVNVWQQMTVELLPDWKTIVGKCKKRYSENAQTAILNYLKLRSIYGFANYLWKQVDNLCHELGVSDNEHNQEDIEQAKENLIIFFEAFAKVDVIDIIQDDVAGFDTLEQAVAGFGTRTNFPVLDRLWFLDIVGTIKNKKLWPDDSWDSVLNDTVPTEPNVGGLMESEEDNKTVRLY